jgi:hypothetical protein
VELACRQQDVNLVKTIIPDAEKEFTRVFKEQCGHDQTVKVNVNTDHFLDDEGKQVYNILNINKFGRCCTQLSRW